MATAANIVAPPEPAVVVEAEPLPVSAPADQKPVNQPHADEKVDDSKAVVLAENAPDVKKSSKSLDRDVALAQVANDKQASLIKAWEENEKTKVENKAEKKLSDVTTWENNKKADLESALKKIEVQTEKKKSEYAEKMRNKIGEVHKQADETRAMIEARRQEEILKAEEMAAKYRATSQAPKPIGCFGS